MNIVIITPAPKGSRSGNRASANRWAAIFRNLGHKVKVLTEYSGEDTDFMVALHAWRSANSIKKFSEMHPDLPLVVVLTGTDAYRFINTHKKTTTDSLKVATIIVGINHLIKNILPKEYLSKLRVIVQSAKPNLNRRPLKRLFNVCFAGHLREEKDPETLFEAIRELPKISKIKVNAYGKAHSKKWEKIAIDEMKKNDRFQWHGEISHANLRNKFSSSHLLISTSIMEGGANVISEAIMADLPIIASDIDGNIGLLGQDYPGYFKVKNAKSLKDKLLQIETNPKSYNDLIRKCISLKSNFKPENEMSGWKKLITEALKIKNN
tara:strand:- start:4235 stop:5200 length:966 start_codon:yes stop_codon:yes gene_type:complete